MTLLIAMVSGMLAPAAPAQILASKRGFADTGGNYSYIQATNASWYHTWGVGLGNPGNSEALHIPMFRWWTNIQGHVDWALTRPQPTEWVMCFNEPERADQDNLTVTEAISRCWTIANGLAGSGIKIAGPAVSDDGAGQAWLASFMSQATAQGLPIDAVCFHWYGVSNPNDPVGAANSFLSRVDSYHNSYGRPVFITEFAIHDWGGAYSDEQIRAANAIFLRTAIPGLESRSYVAGYAFYNWFNDSRLVEGSPLKPTNVGVEYVGVLDSGDSYDFSADDLGEHVAYLGGGELTHNSAGGILHYINALSGTSTISGGVDWSLSGTNWVRVQPGATLRKAGTNRITWNNTVVTSGNPVEIREGELLFNDCDMAGVEIVRAESGATAGYNGDRRVNIDHTVELAGGTLYTAVTSGITLTANGAVVGDGVVNCKLGVGAGGLLQVGGPGLPATPSQFVIDDFESYAPGLVRDVASPPWTAHGGGLGTSFAAIEDDGSNQALSFGWSADFRGTSRPLPEHGQIDEGEVATFFFRFRSKTDDPDHNIGLGDRADTTGVNFGDFESHVRLFADSNPTPGTFGFDARDGGTHRFLISSLTINTWYNVWMVINQSTDTFDVYLNTGLANATAGNKLNSTPLAFRNGTSNPLNTILALAGPGGVDYGVLIDDLTFLGGVDLTNPRGGLDPQRAYDPARLTINGDLTLLAGSSVELGVADSANFDVLAVTGQLNAGGTLAAVIDPNTPPPQGGDTFDIIDATSINGAFGAILLDPIAPGTVWDLRSLYTSGTISVLSLADVLGDNLACLSGPDIAASPGCTSQDQDADGDVDMNDFATVQECVTRPDGVISAGCLRE